MKIMEVRIFYHSNIIMNRREIEGEYAVLHPK